MFVNKAQKNPSIIGVWRSAHSPSSCGRSKSAGIGTLLDESKWVAGLRRAVSLHLS